MSMSLRLVLSALLPFFAYACSGASSKGIRVGADTEKEQASSTRAAGDDDECSPKDEDKKKSTSEKKDDEDDDEEEDDEEASLNLLAGEAVYKGQVDAIINRACTNCHGGTAPRLETFAQLDMNSTAVVNRIKRAAGQAGKMPPANNAQQLSAADIALIEKWVADGKLEVAPPAPSPSAEPQQDDDDEEEDDDDDKSKDDDDEEDEESEDEDDSKSSTSKKKKSDCDTSSSAKSDDIDCVYLDNGKKGWEIASKDEFASLIDTEKRGECHDDDKFFDRRTSKDDPKGLCDEAEWPADFACTRSGIEKAFGGSAEIKKALDEAEKDGFTYYDQCGNMPDGRPVVSLLAPTTVKGEKRLKVRIIREPKDKD